MTKLNYIYPPPEPPDEFVWEDRILGGTQTKVRVSIYLRGASESTKNFYKHILDMVEVRILDYNISKRGK